MEKNVTDSYTEIYIGGGDAWITESKTTVFHNFYKRLILLPGMSEDDYIEVTDAEKQRLEKIRDEWTRPPQAFIDRWNEACVAGKTELYCLGELRQVGTFNEDTGYFELNGLTDLTYADALEIMKVGHVTIPSYAAFGNGSKVRTNLPVFINGPMTKSNVVIYGNYTMEVLTVESYVYGDTAHFYASAEQWQWVTRTATALHTVIGWVYLTKAAGGKVFWGAPNLRFVNFMCAQNISADLSSNPLLDVSVFEFLASPTSDSYNSKLTLHADTYAKLTADTGSEVYNNLPEDEKARWQAAFEALTAKNFTFVCAE